MGSDSPTMAAGGASAGALGARPGSGTAGAGVGMAGAGGASGVVNAIPSVIPRPLVRPIPSVARGFEEEYTRFLNMRLVYKPNADDTGRVDIPVSTFIDLLVDPLSGTFDLSRFGDDARYISIHTGYRKGMIDANASKLEIWLCPKFLAEREVGRTAGHLAPIMGEWTNPVGYFWTWGGWDNMGWYDYLVTGDVGMAADKNLYEKWRASRLEPRPMCAPPHRSTIASTHGSITNIYIYMS